MTSTEGPGTVGSSVGSASVKPMPSALSRFPALSARELELVSVDGQFYSRCEACGFEDRYAVEPEADGEGEDRAHKRKATNAPACLGCGKKAPRAPSRHMLRDRGLCLDCDASFDVLTGPWEISSCASCNSQRLKVLETTVEPAFPPSFGERANPAWFFGQSSRGKKTHTWGLGGVDDAMLVKSEADLWKGMPNAHTRTYLLILFAERLRANCVYDDAMGRYLIANIEANLAQDYFRATGWFPCARLALELFERMIEVAPDPPNKALAQHSFAMGAFSLFARFSGEFVAAAISWPALRETAIARAEEAEHIFEELAADGMQGADVQVARVRWVLGDLVRVGSRDDEQRRRAIAYFDQALGNEQLARHFGFALHESRGATLAALEEPHEGEPDRAVEDLQTAMEAGGSDAAYAGRWRSAYLLSRLLVKHGMWKEALPLFQQAASVAWQQFQALGDEQQLVLQSEQFAPVFEGLASLYASVGWSDEALALTEITRCSAVRLYTMDAAERATFVATNKEKAMESLFPAALKDAGMPGFGRMPSKEHIDDVLEELAIGADVVPVLNAHEGIATGILTLLEDQGTMTALLCTSASPEEREQRTTDGGTEDDQEDSVGPRWKIAREQWKLTPRQIAALVEGRHVAPGPFREQLIARLCQQGGESLLAPLLEPLRAAGVSRLLVSMPGSMTGLPLEAFTNAQAEPILAGLGISVGYLPSIRLGSDLIDYRRTVESAPSRSVLFIGYGGDDLQASTAEYEGIAAACGTDLTYVPGSEATKDRVLTALRGEYDIVHIQGHGTFDPGNPLASALHFTSDFDDDARRITAFDLLNEVRLPRAPLIVLSACSSAITSGWRTGTYHGLLGSLLRVGGVGVIGSRWPVADDGAARFMIRFHQILRSPDSLPERALHTVAQELRAEGVGPELCAAFGYFGVS